jgi:RNAse (barnase) inhibitor barstar
MKAIIGESDFKIIRQSCAYYVDKSLFIEEVLTSPYKIILLTRPRRFGKTLNLSLLYHFLRKRETNESALFDGLAIQSSEIFDAHFSKYPLIYLTFKDIKTKTFHSALNKISFLIQCVIEKYPYLLTWDKLSLSASQMFERISYHRATLEDYEDSLKVLCEQLALYHNMPVVILTDEYDTPIHTAYTNGYYDEMIGFMRNLLSGAYKDNSSLFRGVITGTLRIAKESIFTGLNNLGVFTLLDDEFEEYFGFTISEVKKLLNDFQLVDYYDDIIKWYDGYIFGNNTILNPWSVMSFIAQRKKRFKPYWLNTASMEMIEEALTPNQQTLRDELYDLIKGQTIIKPIYDNIVFSDLKNKKSNLLWSFLLHSGYLTVFDEVESQMRQKFHIQIPNCEVRMMYYELVEKWIKNHVDLGQLELLLTSLKKGDIHLFEKKLSSICKEIMSFHDFAGTPEKVYHALVLGMLVWLSDDYEIRSNRESGYGRYDIIFKPKDLNNQGIIIEFKMIDKETNADDILNAALKQIDEKQYDTELKAAGVDDILKIAVGFTGKAVFLKHN